MLTPLSVAPLPFGLIVNSAVPSAIYSPPRAFLSRVIVPFFVLRRNSVVPSPAITPSLMIIVFGSAA